MLNEVRTRVRDVNLWNDCVFAFCFRILNKFFFSFSSSFMAAHTYIVVLCNLILPSWPWSIIFNFFSFCCCCCCVCFLFSYFLSFKFPHISNQHQQHEQEQNSTASSYFSFQHHSLSIH